MPLTRLIFDHLLNLQVEALKLTRPQLGLVGESLSKIAGWLNGPGAFRSKPQLYTQGSIRLRTSITPKKGGEFDADMVCEFDLDAEIDSPTAAFAAVGDRLLRFPEFSGIVKRKRRCWALVYDEGYHVDVTPCVANPSRGDSSVLVKQGASGGSRISDPIGFADWFLGRAAPTVRPIDPLREPDWIASYTHVPVLARAVQLLKRRRDVWYGGAPGPPSMVLTTLAAQFYEGEGALSETLFNTMDKMIRFLEERANQALVVNPINESEVLSEAWLDDESARSTFLQFIAEFNNDLLAASGAGTVEQMAIAVGEMFGSEARPDTPLEGTQ